MKKFLSVVFAGIVALVAALSINAASTGSIEINRNQTTYDTTYSVYRLLDLSYDDTNKAYAYTLNSTWKAFFTTGEGKNYVTIDTLTDASGNNYVTFKSAKSGASDVAAFAKAALKYAKDNKIAANGTKQIAKGESKATISDLQLGYYLVDSTLGALCHLDSTSFKATINEKNREPNIEKTATTPVVKGSAQIGDKVNYQINVTVEAGYEKYVVTDKMTSGLTYNSDVSVKYYDKNGIEVTPATAATINNTATSTYTFKVDFSKVELSNVAKIEVKYSATVNKDAATTTEQKNEAQLTFGDDNKTDKEKSTITIKTYSATFKKTDKENHALTGAKFKLYDSLTGGKEVKVVKVSDGVYRVAEASETGVEIEAGSVEIKGLAKTTYYLEETLPPVGYQKLGARFAITSDNEVPYNVINTTSVALPSTGGVGTTLFVLVGSMLVLALGTVLVSKYRMSKINE